MTWYIPRCPLRYYSLVHSGKKPYFFGIRPIRDVGLTCIFRPIFPFVCCIKDMSQYYSINFLYKYVIKCCYHDIELYFVPYFGAELGTMFIMKVYIYIPCNNTQRRATVPFNDAPITSSLQSEPWTTGNYHVYSV